MNHGGKREGSGRKIQGTEKKLTTGITITPTVKRWLDDQKDSNGSIVENLIRKSKPFKDWQKLSK